MLDKIIILDENCSINYEDVKYNGRSAEVIVVSENKYSVVCYKNGQCGVNEPKRTTNSYIEAVNLAIDWVDKEV